MGWDARPAHLRRLRVHGAYAEVHAGRRRKACVVNPSRSSARFALLRRLAAGRRRRLADGRSAFALTREEAESSSRAAMRLSCNHEWLYLEREPGETYTGYCERCPKCGTIRQIPQ